MIYATALSDVDPETDLQLLASVSAGKTTRLYAYRDGPENLYGSSVYDQELYLYDTLYGSENSIYVSAQELPYNLKMAFVCIEDKRFYRHDGIDWYRTLGAGVNHVLHFRSAFGGSTITQQLVKNVSGENQTTVRRKIREMVRATQLERRLSKDEILAGYLNVIPLGNNCFGVGAAASYYFDKTVEQLTLVECAALAAATNAPYRYDPVRFPEANAQRRRLVLSAMQQAGVIGEEEAGRAMEEELTLHLKPTRNGEYTHNWYVESAAADVIRDLSEKLQISRRAASAMVYGGGLQITLAVHPALQAGLEEILEQVPTDEGRHYAALLLSPSSGNLLAVAGDGGPKTANRLLNYATEVRRPPGSTLKPLALYAPALESRMINWGTQFWDVPMLREDGSIFPHNSPDRFAGRISAYEALANSKNTVAVQLYERLGKEWIFRHLSEKLEFSSLVRNGGTGSRAVSDLAASPLALGQLTYGVTLEELARAYAAFPTGGEMPQVRSYLQVCDREGNPILENTAVYKKIWSPQTASIMTQMLTGVTSEGTARHLTVAQDLDTAGKTGTTSGDADRYFVGFTPYLLSAVRITDMKGVYGTVNAISLSDRILRTAHAPVLDNPSVPVRSFIQAPGTILLPYCADSGGVPDRACAEDARGSRIRLGFFTPDNAPRHICSDHGYYVFDAENSCWVPDPTAGFFPGCRVFLKKHALTLPDGTVLSEDPYVCPEPQEPSPEDEEEQEEAYGLP